MNMVMGWMYKGWSRLGRVVLFIRPFVYAYFYIWELS